MQDMAETLPSLPGPAQASQVKSATRTLDIIEFVVAHNYPGAFDNAASTACFTNFPDGVRWYSVADLTSSRPSWKMRSWR